MNNNTFSWKFVSDKTEEIIILEKFFASKAAKPSAWIKFVLIIQIRFKRKIFVSRKTSHFLARVYI